MFICIGICYASCNYLDVVPDQIPTIEDAFRDRYAVEKSLATCYWGLPRLGDYNSNPALLGALEMVLNREHIYDKGMQKGLGYDSPNATVFSYWGSTNEGGVRSIYAGIRDCNTFLENIEAVKDMSRYEKDRVIAEVKTIKAYMHFYLICYYGPICPLRENVPVGESTSEIRFYREKIDDCFAYVFELLDEVIASDDLPWTIDTKATELGRFVRSVAYMLKAKALVYWASDLFNGNADFNDFYNHEGEPFFNQTYDATRWVQAAEACKKAVEVCTGDGIRLYQIVDYVQEKKMSDSTLLVNILRCSVSERFPVESIWGNTSAFAGDNIQWGAMPKLSATSFNPSGLLSVPFSTVELFYSEHGVPINEDIDWRANGDERYNARFSPKTGDATHRYYIHQGEQTGAMNFNREPRFYSTLGFDRGKWYGNHFQSTPDNDVDALYPRNRWGEFSSQVVAGNYNATGYWPKKLVGFNTSFQDATRNFMTPYPFPDMRFADLLLLTAEALNESKANPDTEVYQYIDMVRERAGLEGVVESWKKYSVNPDNPADKVKMREIIRRERKIELACEGHYYWDVRRWKTAVSELNNRLIQGWNVTASDVNQYYTISTIYPPPNFSIRDYFAPIPESDMIKNPNLIQNPGW
jgi:hypothetical protein